MISPLQQKEWKFAFLQLASFLEFPGAWDSVGFANTKRLWDHRGIVIQVS